MRVIDQSLFDHDKALFEAVRDSVPAPEGVGAVVFEEGEDSYGDPAAWIWVMVKPELNPSNKRISILNAYVARLRDELLDRGIKSYPYFTITESRPRASERQRVARR